MVEKVQAILGSLLLFFLIGYICTSGMILEKAKPQEEVKQDTIFWRYGANDEDGFQIPFDTTGLGFDSSLIAEIWKDKHRRDSILVEHWNKTDEGQKISALPYCNIRYEDITDPMYGVVTFTQQLKKTDYGFGWQSDTANVNPRPHVYELAKDIRTSEIYPGFSTYSRYLEELFMGNGYIIGKDTFTAAHVIEGKNRKKYPLTAHWARFGADIATTNDSMKYEVPTSEMGNVVSVTGIAIDNEANSDKLKFYSIYGQGIITTEKVNGITGTCVVLRKQPKYPYDCIAGVSGSIAVITTKNGERYLGIASWEFDPFEELAYEIVCRMDEVFWWEQVVLEKNITQ